MFIYIARHAWAGERGDPRWPDDSLRELTPEGIERYTEVVKALAEHGFAPARIVTSPYTRCRQTADIIAKYVDGKPEIDELEALEPGSDLDPLIEWTNEQGGKDVCWVGHSPDVERLGGRVDRRRRGPHSLCERGGRRDRLRRRRIQCRRRRTVLAGDGKIAGSIASDYLLESLFSI